MAEETEREWYECWCGYGTTSDRNYDKHGDEHMRREARAGEGPSAGTPELALTIIRDALEVIRELKKLEEEWPAWYLTVEAEAEKFVTGADTPTGPHSSVIYTDLNVRCHACQRNVIWHYLEDVDTIQFLHSCDDAVGPVLPATPTKEKA